LHLWLGGTLEVRFFGALVRRCDVVFVRCGIEETFSTACSKAVVYPVGQVYAAVLWQVFLASLLCRVLLRVGQCALHRLDALYKDVRNSEKYVRSERLLNRDEVVPGADLEAQV
jgi:hypothetical protein